MGTSDYLAWPDEHLRASVAAAYDASVADRFTADAIDPAVRVLAELAGGGPAVEFAVGTGRLALPLAATGTPVHGIDFSESMLAELRIKDGSERVSLSVGDMTTTRVCDDAALVYPARGAPYVLVVLTSGIESQAAARTLIADITRIVHAALQR